MARGKDERNNMARVVDMRAWKMRNHPSMRGKSLAPKGMSGGVSEDSDPTPPHGIPRPDTSGYED